MSKYFTLIIFDRFFIIFTKGNNVNVNVKFDMLTLLKKKKNQCKHKRKIRHVIIVLKNCITSVSHDNNKESRL